MRSGRLEIICGPMYSGKSEELMRRLRRAKIANKDVILVKTKIDDRYEDDHVVSHNGVKMEAVAADFDDLREIVDSKEVVGIDEVQFYSEHVYWLIQDLVEEGKTVIVSGLDMTYRREPFGVMGPLLAIADSVDKYTAICHKCGEEASFTQRLIDGEPASFKGDTIVVGGLDSYEARCRLCFESAP